MMMPRLNGYGVLEQLKQEGRLHNLPVIMVSALNELDSVVRCIEIGAVDYLAKPFNPVLLSARIGASLEKKRLRDEVRTHPRSDRARTRRRARAAAGHGSLLLPTADGRAAGRDLRNDGAGARGRWRSL